MTSLQVLKSRSLQQFFILISFMWSSVDESILTPTNHLLLIQPTAVLQMMTSKVNDYKL